MKKHVKDVANLIDANPDGEWILLVNNRLVSQADVASLSSAMREEGSSVKFIMLVAGDPREAATTIRIADIERREK